jgi:hypothetical protein
MDFSPEGEGDILTSNYFTYLSIFPQRGNLTTPHPFRARCRKIEKNNYYYNNR